MTESKDTNPKDAVGTGKAPISAISAPVIAEIGLAMLEGARKYGRHNYRVSGVRASVYYDAVFRHLASFYEGEDVDPDSGLSHITKAIACLVVLRDSMIRGNWVDDRPPATPAGWLTELNAKAAAIVAKYPESKESFLATDTPADVDRKLGRVPSPAQPTEFAMGDRVAVVVGHRAGDIGRVSEVTGLSRYPYRVEFASGDVRFFSSGDLKIAPREDVAPEPCACSMCLDGPVGCGRFTK